MGKVTSTLGWQRSQVKRMRKQIAEAACLLETWVEDEAGDEPVGETLERVWQTVKLDPDTQLQLAKEGLMARVLRAKEEDVRTLLEWKVRVNGGQTS